MNYSSDNIHAKAPQFNDFENFYLVNVNVEIFLNDYEDLFSSKIGLKNRIERYLGGGIWNSSSIKYVSHSIKYVSHEILEELHFIKTHVANCNGAMLFLEKFENEDGSYCYKELKHKPNLELVKIEHVSKNGSDWIETETWSAKIFENDQKKNIEDVVLKNGINTLQEGPGVEYYEKDNSSSP